MKLPSMLKISGVHFIGPSIQDSIRRLLIIRSFRSVGLGFMKNL